MGITTTTKAAARRWLAARDGREIDTVQVRPDGMVWRPGPRTVAVDGTRITADGSELRLTADHVVLEADARLVVEWLDSDGTQIHVTSYTDVPGADDDAGDDDAGDDDAGDWD